MNHINGIPWAGGVVALNRRAVHVATLGCRLEEVCVPVPTLIIEVRAINTLAVARAATGK